MWDVVFDWGLLHPAPGRKWDRTSGLRSVLLLRPIIPVYHLAVCFNLVGRTLWSLRWSKNCALLGGFACATIQQGSEVLRRCLWNVLRVEWEVVKRGLHLSQPPELQSV